MERQRPAAQPATCATLGEARAARRTKSAQPKGSQIDISADGEDFDYKYTSLNPSPTAPRKSKAPVGRQSLRYGSVLKH
jgi:hypothetical protein